MPWRANEKLPADKRLNTKPYMETKDWAKRSPCKTGVIADVLESF